MTNRDKTKQKELVDFIVQAQRTIVHQRKCLKDVNFDMEKKTKEYLLFLIEIVENFDSLYEKISCQEDRFDRASLRVFNSFKIIRNKVSHYLESNSVQKIDLRDREVKINLCEVVDTEKTNDDEMKGKIKSILSDGHLYGGEVLKAARVITYR